MMVDPSRTVFLSYRRSASWQLAEAVQGRLTARGFDVFVDTKDLGNGLFDEVILAEIARRRHVVVLLQPGSLDRIGEQGDWLRREIAHALELRRNVVPVVAGTAIPRTEELPASIADLSRLTAVTVHPDYFDEAMEKLCRRFLRTPDPLPSSPGIVLSAPTLTARAKALRATLSWTPVDGAVGYELEESPTSDFSLPRLIYRRGCADYVPPTRARRSDERFYRVRAVGTGVAGHGPWSNVVEVAGHWWLGIVRLGPFGV
jgi:hypothetical protein